MDEKTEQFLQKIRTFSEEVNLYFSSDLIVKPINELINEYDLDDDFIYNLIYDFFISDFNVDKLKKDIVGRIDNVEKFVSDFLGKLFLPVASFIEFKVKEHIKNLENYRKYVDDFSNLIESHNVDELLDFVDDLENKIDFKEEEELVVDFLGKSITEVLKSQDYSGPQKVNGSALYLLINKPDCLNRFIKTFLSNQEKIGSKKIILDNREEEPTIANWIKHFIRENGNEIFGSIVLAKYLTSTFVNTLLNEEDKKILRKVLKLYRNLIFFPESMANIPREDWEIFPVERDVILNNKIEKKKEENKQEKEIIKPKIEQKVEIIKEVKKNKELDLPDLKNKELKELEDLLIKYPEKSLERKAIENEIKKINNKK
jgi:hypothetical protein